MNDELTRLRTTPQPIGSNDAPIPFSACKGPYPTKCVLYNWTRPSEVREELERAGVIARINGRWLFNPMKWREHCTNQFRNREPHIRQRPNHGAVKHDVGRALLGRK